LLSKIQTTIHDYLDDQQITKDLFELPRDALEYIISSSETCIGELKLFQAISAQIESVKK